MSYKEGSSDCNIPGLADTSGSDEEYDAPPWRGPRKDDADSDEETQPPRPLSVDKAKAKSEQLRIEGNDFFNKDLFNKAIAKYSEALQANPVDMDNTVKCYRNMSMCYSKKKEFRQAVDHAILAVEAQPTCAPAWVRCWVAYIEMGKPLVAGTVLLKGLKRMPNSDIIKKEWQSFSQKSEAEVRHAQDYCNRNTSSDIRKIEIDYDNQKDLEEEILAVKKYYKERRLQAEEITRKKELERELEREREIFPKIKRMKTEHKRRDPEQEIEAEEEKLLKEQKRRDPEQEIKAEEEKLLKEHKRRDPEQEIKAEEEKLPKEHKRRDLEQEIKAEEEKLPKEHKRRDPEQEIKARFKKVCNEASTRLINRVPAMEGFSEALDMVDKQYKALWTTSQYKDLSHNEEVVVIKYMFARACCETINYNCILAGLSKLDEIKDYHEPVKFATVFYGLSSLWIKLNRFEKAAAAVEDGIEFLERGFNVTPYNWPGIPTKLVEETKKEILLEKLRILAVDLKCPPRPDAVCRGNNCNKNQSHIVPSENIYISDPDYKGYFKVSCRMDCQVCYHKACWIVVKGENIEKLKMTKVPTEKDFLGQSCFTPDCDAVIVKIEIFEDNFSKMTTIQDVKLIEKLENEERKHKEEARIKKEREEHEKRVKMFEEKQMKKNREKQSKKVDKKSNKKKDQHNGKHDFLGEEFSKRNSNVNMRNSSKHEMKKGTDEIDKKDRSVRHELTCCYPDGCSQKNKVLNRDDLSDTQRVTCSNSKCDQSGYMHLACFLKFETTVVGFLGKQPRGRMWTQQQCLGNVWSKKGYEVAFKMYGCLCGHGKLRKDADWTAPKAKAVVKEDATVSVTEKKKTVEKVKLEPLRESFESSHVHGSKPSIMAQQMKEKIVGKLSKESPVETTSKQMMPEQISCNFQTKINTKRSNLVNTNGITVAYKDNENHIANKIVNASAQTNLALMNFGDVDRDALQQQNEKLILELQEMKDMFYKIQSERKIVAKEHSDKNASMAEDNNNIRIENDSFKEKISKMKKTINDATKTSDELRKVRDLLKSTRSKLEDTQKRLKVEQYNGFQTNSQLTVVSQENELESQLNDLLRAKQLQNDLRKYREILRQKQENNLNIITLLRGTRELDNIPQIQLALSSLNEYSARLLLAEEELNNQYATLVRQSEDNKTIQDLYFDLSSVEPPNLGPSFLNLLDSFVIFQPVTSTFSFPPAPNSLSSTSSLLPDLSTVTARGDARGPHVAKTIFSNPPPGYATLSTFPGTQVSGHSNSFVSASISQDSFQTASASASLTSVSPPGSPASHSRLAKTGVAVNNPTSASKFGTSDRAIASYPTSAGASASNPSSVGATTLYATSAEPTENAIKAKSIGATVTSTRSTAIYLSTATKSTSSGVAAGSSQSAIATNPTGVKLRVSQNIDGASAKTGKQYNKLICLLQKNHPNLSPSQALDYVMRLRKSNNGRLTGMSVKDILDRVASFIDRDQDGDCSICFEDMESGDSVYLNPCHHRFHKVCINQWLESSRGAGSTCPMCRNYIVKEDELTNLGAARRF